MPSRPDRVREWVVLTVPEKGGLRKVTDGHSEGVEDPLDVFVTSFLTGLHIPSRLRSSLGGSKRDFLQDRRSRGYPVSGRILSDIRAPRER